MSPLNFTIVPLILSLLVQGEFVQENAGEQREEEVGGVDQGGNPQSFP